MTDVKPARLAVLIDAENVLPSFADLIFESAASMGDVVAREIYGVAAALTTWVEPVLRYAIHPNLTIKASKSKNTSDIALVIGAMDVLLKSDVDTVVIVSSDSDFSGLSVRLRTAGINVVGMGTDKSNPLWRTACSSFIVLEHPAPAPKATPRSTPQPQKPQQPQQQPKAQPKQQQSQKSAEAAPAQPQQKANSTHKDRVAAIKKIILKMLASGGGRLQTNTLFTELNKVPEYTVDRKGSGKKALNYLTSTYGDFLDFEDSNDGQVWVTVKGPAEVAETVEPETEPVVEEKPEAIVEEAPAVEATPEPVAEEAPAEIETPEPVAEEGPVEDETPEPAAEETPEPVEEEAHAGETTEPVAEDEPVEAAEPEDEDEPVVVDDLAMEPDPAIDMFIDKMQASGVDREVAETIARIFAQSDNFFRAYNAIRKVYGNAGREYYNRAREIVESLKPE